MTSTYTNLTTVWTVMPEIIISIPILMLLTYVHNYWRAYVQYKNCLYSDSRYQMRFKYKIICLVTRKNNYKLFIHSPLSHTEILRVFDWQNICCIIRVQNNNVSLHAIVIGWIVGQSIPRDYLTIDYHLMRLVRYSGNKKRRNTT